MSDEELVKLLRSMHWCVTTEANGVGVSDKKVAPVAADRIEQLTAERDHAWAMVANADTQMGQSLADHLQAKAERDRLREALERIAGVKGPYSHPFPESNEGYGSFAIVTAREALKGEKA